MPLLDSRCVTDAEAKLARCLEIWWSFLAVRFGPSTRCLAVFYPRHPGFHVAIPEFTEKERAESAEGTLFR